MRHRALKRSLRAVAWAALLAALAAAPAPAPDERPFHLAFLAEVEERSPRLAAALAMAAAASQVPIQAVALPDPVVALGVRNVAAGGWTVGEQMMSQVGLVVSQKFPNGGVRNWRATAAGFEAERLALEAVRVRLEVRQMALTSLYRLQTVALSQRIVAGQREILRGLVGALEARYATGEGGQHDLLRAQVALSARTAKARLLEAERAGVVATLNALRDRPPDTPVGPVTLPAPPISGSGATPALSLAANPELAGLAAGVAAAEARVAALRAGFGPDYQVGLGYWDRGGLDPILHAQVGISLPAFSRARDEAALAQGEAALAGAKAAMAARRAGLLGDLARLEVEAQVAADLVLLHDEGFVPQAEFSYRSALAAYEGGSTSILMVLDNLVRWEEFQIARAQRVAAWGAAWAALDAIRGRGAGAERNQNEVES